MFGLRMRRVSWSGSALLFVACVMGAAPTCSIDEPDENAIRGITEDFTISGVFDSDPAKDPEDKPNATIWFGVQQAGIGVLWEKYQYPHTHGSGMDVANRKDGAGNEIDWPTGTASADVGIAQGQHADDSTGVWINSYHTISFVDGGSSS